MAYELRLDGRPLGRFQTREAVLDQASGTLADRPDREPQTIDLTTGRPPPSRVATTWPVPSDTERAGRRSPPETADTPGPDPSAGTRPVTIEHCRIRCPPGPSLGPDLAGLAPL